MEYTIKDVTIINPNNTIDNADITIKGNKIASITIKKGMGNKFLIPGFVDLHIHGIKNNDVMDGEKAVINISKNLAKLGTTSFMPTLMTNSWKKIIESLNQVSKIKQWKSRFLGIHIEGPFIDETKKGAHKKEFLLKATKKRIDQLIEASDFKLKRISFDPKMVNLQTFSYLKNELNVYGSIGHSDANFKMANQYFEKGCDSVCHLWNAMSGVDSRNPGIVQSALYNQNVFVELIIDFVHICKETVDFTIKMKGVDNIIAISDAIKPAYYKNGLSISGDLQVYKKNKLIKINGTDTIAGSAIVIYDAFLNLLKSNYSLNDAVKMTSYNAIRYLNIKNLGIIEKDYLADFLILNKKNYKIEKVFFNGKRVK
ncbi:N-acetylglucosamine-6-phosphate deacetylase [Mesomycoplasma lagogenitalium]|uniref:Amidohydrolase family protein n=1 Tax=Mesomycoplasma lagogenitalium TaxID=171286 RepID=A0ABY8LTZ3_9BACT|nr:amidohydrolase family protein [Mesomycoplasma lagogenitalium]WGI36710.1 amidohydrolase family protein [Mesomycoplasma lagogenitalium]